MESLTFGAHLYPFLRHENLVAGGDAGGRLRMASVVHGQQVGEHGDGGEEGGGHDAGDLVVDDVGE